MAPVTEQQHVAPLAAIPPIPHRLFSIDFLKALAMIAVIVSHAGLLATDPRYSAWDEVLRRHWTAFHVPAFLFVAGFLYHRPHPIRVAEVGHRLLRILVPYLLATCVLFALGLPFGRPHWGYWYPLWTGAADGPYYFVFVLTYCIVTTWAISRLSSAALVVVALTLLTYLFAIRWFPDLRLSTTFFWYVRDPLRNFYLGYFILGWLSASHKDNLVGLYRRHNILVLAFAFGGLVTQFWTAFSWPFRSGLYLDEARAIYTIAVVILAVTAAGRVPQRLHGTIRFVSDTTLAIYLTHMTFMRFALGHVVEWHPVPRTLATAIVSMMGPIGIVILARGILGRKWARRLLGA